MNPAPKPCPQRADLAEALQSVMERLLRFYKLKVRTIKMGDLVGLEKLSGDVEELLKLEKSLREKLTAHIQTHGC